MTGTELIAKERQRQIEEEGWDTQYDDGHPAGDLAVAGACYAFDVAGFVLIAKDCWPWGKEWWKPTPNDSMRQLVKAGALIAAEIDKLQRQRGSK